PRRVRLPARRRPPRRHGLLRHPDGRQAPHRHEVHAHLRSEPPRKPPPRHYDHQRSNELLGRITTSEPVLSTQYVRHRALFAPLAGLSSKRGSHPAGHATVGILGPAWPLTG